MGGGTIKTENGKSTRHILKSRISKVFNYFSKGNASKKTPPSVTSVPSEMNRLSMKMNGLSTRSANTELTKASDDTRTQSK